MSQKINLIIKQALATFKNVDKTVLNSNLEKLKTLVRNFFLLISKLMSVLVKAGICTWCNNLSGRILKILENVMNLIVRLW